MLCLCLYPLTHLYLQTSCERVSLGGQGRVAASHRKDQHAGRAQLSLVNRADAAVRTRPLSDSEAALSSAPRADSAGHSIESPLEIRCSETKMRNGMCQWQSALPFLRCRRLTLPSWLVPATRSPVLGDSRLSREAEESS